MLVSVEHAIVAMIIAAFAAVKIPLMLVSVEHFFTAIFRFFKTRIIFEFK